MTAVAALWDELVVDDDQLGDVLPGPLLGGSTVGTPLIPGELANCYLSVQVAFGADPGADPATWEAFYVDITGDVLQDQGRTIAIKVGRMDWSSFAYPATCTFAAANLNGDYTGWNPYARWWPNLVAGTPVRVRIYLDGVPYDRFVGELAGAPQPNFDVTGNYAISVFSCVGSLQRIEGGSGQQPTLHSPYARSILAAGPKHYWSLEDGANATSGGPLTNGSPVMAMNTAVGAVRFASLDLYTAGKNQGVVLAAGTTFGVNTSQPQYKEGGALRAFLPPTATPWSVQFLSFVAISGSDADTIYSPCGWVTSDGSLWQIYFDPYGTDTTYLVYNGTTVCTVNSLWIFDDMRVDATQVGSDIHVTFTRQPFPAGLYTATGVISGKTLYGITSIATNPKQMVTTGDWMISHVRIWENTSEPDFMTLVSAASAFTGYNGETCTARLARLCGELGVPYTTVGAPSTITMGVQPSDTASNLLRECEATDAGLLFDGLRPGVQYQPLAARYNAATVLSLDASAGELQPPYQPVDDQFGRINTGTVTSRDGSTAVYTAASGPLGTNRIGVYSGGPPVAPNYANNSMLAARAGWEARKGTLTGYRYPSINLNLRTIPGKVRQWLSVLPGSLASITPPYPAILTTDVIPTVIEGWQENLAKFVWTVTAYGSRGDVYTVAAVDSARVDTAGSSLAADAPAGSTSLSVASVAAPWSTNAASYTGGLDFSIDGVRVTVTAVTGSTSPQTFTCQPTSRQLYVGNDVHLWTPAYPALG